MRGHIAEALYGAWAVLAACGAIQMGFYLWEFRALGRASSRIRMAIALGALFAGIAAFSAWAWAWYEIWNAGGDPTWLRDLLWIGLAGTFVGAVGIVCVLRLFSRFGHLDWTAALAATAAFIGWSLS